MKTISINKKVQQKHLIFEFAVSSTNKIDLYDMAEILLKVA
jgi:hypothetical protein